MTVRVLALIAAVLAGCTSAPPAGAPAAAPEPAVGAEDTTPVFPDFAPILPGRHEPAARPEAPVRAEPAAPREARLPRPDAAAVKVVPQIDAESVTVPLPPRENRASLEEKLTDVARRLDTFNARAPGDLDEFSRMRIIALTREALLLLLLTNKIDSDACRTILETLKKFPVTNLEVAGLQFVLYQRLADYAKRDDALEHLLREARGRFRLDDLLFCESVVGRDKYVPIEHPEFKSGQRVKIYCGFRGAEARKLPDGGSEQHLQAYLSILDGAGKRLEAVEFLDKGRGVRKLESGESAGSPSYICGEYVLPANLRPGRYQLELSASDLVGRTAESKATVAFEVRE